MNAREALEHPALTVACPNCGALISDQCRSPGDRRRDTPHRERIERYELSIA